MDERISFEISEMFESLGCYGRGYGHVHSWSEVRANMGIKFDDPLPATGYGIPHQRIEDDVDWKIDMALANGADWETLKALYPTHNVIVSSFKVAPKKVKQFNAAENIAMLIRIVEERMEDIRHHVGGYCSNRHEFPAIIRKLVSGEYSIREIAVDTGWMKKTIQKILTKLRVFMKSNSYPEIVCRCGTALVSHKGMCHIRFVRATGRQTILTNWHSNVDLSGRVILGRSFDSLHVQRAVNE